MSIKITSQAGLRKYSRVDKEQMSDQLTFKQRVGEVLKTLEEKGCLADTELFDDLSALVWDLSATDDPQGVLMLHRTLRVLNAAVAEDDKCNMHGIEEHEHIGRMKEILSFGKRLLALKPAELSEYAGRVRDVLKRHRDWVPWGVAKHESMLDDASFSRAVFELDDWGMLEEDRKPLSEPLLKLINQETTSGGEPHTPA